MKEYAVIYEWAGENYSAYVPDLPGCVACGDTVEETEELMKEAIELYIEGLRNDGQPIPEPTTKARTFSAMRPITLYDVLDEIRNRPGMYFGDNSIHGLYAFLSGFGWAEEKLGVRLTPETPSLIDFHNWTAKKFGWYESTAGWANIIFQEYDADEEQALRAFFELLDEFRNGPPLVPQDRGPYGRKSWNTWEYAVIFGWTEDGITAYSPDLPRCVVSGNSIAEIEQKIKRAIEQHIEAHSKNGNLIPPPTNFTRTVKVKGIPLELRMRIESETISDPGEKNS